MSHAFAAEADAVLEALKTGDPETRREAAASLAELPPTPERAAALAEALKDQYLLMSAVSALSRYKEGAAPAVPALIRALQSGGKGIHHANKFEVVTEDATGPIIRALGRVGPAAKEALPVIEPYLNHSEPYLRSQARRAYDRISGKDTQPIPDIEL